MGSPEKRTAHKAENWVKFTKRMGSPPVESKEKGDHIGSDIGFHHSRNGQEGKDGEQIDSACVGQRLYQRKGTLLPPAAAGNLTAQLQSGRKSEDQSRQLKNTMGQQCRDEKNGGEMVCSEISPYKADEHGVYAQSGGREVKKGDQAISDGKKAGS